MSKLIGITDILIQLYILYKAQIYVCEHVCLFDGVKPIFQLFRVAVSFIGGGNKRLGENHRPVASH